MRKRTLLLSFILSVFAFSVQAQIVTKYSLGFESAGEPYTTRSDVSIVTQYSSSGNNCIKLSHSSQDTIMLVSDTIDLSDNSTFQYAVLEFNHICDVNRSRTPTRVDVAFVEIKPVTQSTWTRMSSTNYDRSWGGGTSSYVEDVSFYSASYVDWNGTVNNSVWKRERFNVFSFISTVAQSDKKFQIRFVLMGLGSGMSPEGQGWYIDDVKVTASSQTLALPVLSMRNWPDLVKYPNSRATRIDVQATTSATAGIDPDSVYVVYQVGSDHTTNYTVYADPIQGQNNCYRAVIPFVGFDTVVRYSLTVKDATLNHNVNTYPMTAGSWSEYKSVRASANNAFIKQDNLTPETTIPFPAEGDYHVQCYYSKEDLEAAGYKAGEIVSFRYVSNTSVSRRHHDRMQILMMNVDSTYLIDEDAINNGVNFSGGDMKIVYDGPLTITNQVMNIPYTINLQDTFYYAGESLLVSFYSDNISSDPEAIPTNCYATDASHASLHSGSTASMGFDPFTNHMFNVGQGTLKTPNFAFLAYGHQPLVHDAGISAFVTPSVTSSADATSANDVIVTLKNMGSDPMQAIRIWYQIDNDAPQYYDWTGSLAGDATADVTINTTQRYTPGYHTIKAWVDDTLTSNGARWRDHEPYNDTIESYFAACSGPMHGSRQVGGSNADYATLDQFLYALSMCGVDGVLSVKLAPGDYDHATMPAVAGISTAHYVQFESLDPSNRARFRPPTTSASVDRLIYNQSTPHIRFVNLDFYGYSQSDVYATTNYLVRLGTGAKDNHFINCNFREEAGDAAIGGSISEALLYCGGADSLQVKNCTFYRGSTGLSNVGPASDNLAKGAYIYGNSFILQKNSAVEIRNQRAPIVDSNSMDRVTANSSYIILIRDCYGAARITRNSAYSTSGASCLGASYLYGTASEYAVVANNMLVSNDEGTSNMLTTALNIIKAQYVKVVYNSVKMTGPTRTDIAAATLGGDTVFGCIVYNNIFTCFDTSNYAFNYIPIGNYTSTIGYNIYYSRSGMLNKCNGVSCANLAAWRAQYADPYSQELNPSFINSYNTDLRTYSQYVKGKGTPIAEVTIDIVGTVRPTPPCVGAFEFTSLPYDFEVAEMYEPYDEYCNVPTSAPLRVVIRNTGVRTYDPDTTNGSLTLYYAYGNTTSGALTVPVSTIIPADSSIIFNTGHQVSFPTNDIYDSVHTFTIWLSSNIDVNIANDTSRFSLVAHYHFPAPDTVIRNVSYGQQGTIHVSNGVQTWYPYVYSAGGRVNSNVYWYRDPSDPEPFHCGSSLTTGVIYTDTMFYIRQRRDLPLVRISEVQVNRAGSGATYPIPLWMNSSTSFAIELTNVGDLPANLEGDSIVIVSPTNAYNNKVYRFPNVTLPAGHALVLQWRGGISTPDSTVTLGASTLSPNDATSFGVIYTHDGVIDAVPFNDVQSASQWTGRRVPAYVWSGGSVNLPEGSAGAKRSGWPTSSTASPSNTAQFWQVGDSVHSMTVGTVDENLLRYIDNGCEPDYSTVTIHVTQVPPVDISLDSVFLPSGCGIDTVPVLVNVHNYGSVTSDNVRLHFSVNGTTVCSDTIEGLASGGHVAHTFSCPGVFKVDEGTASFAVTVWADLLDDDSSPINDTAHTTVVSSYAPVMPTNIPSAATVNYASRATLTPPALSADSLVWYDREMNALDTTTHFVSDVLFVDDTFYVAALALGESLVHVGSWASLSSPTANPSPYNPNRKYVKEQYLITADEMLEFGHSAGAITSVSFYIDTLNGANDSVVLEDYAVAMGTAEGLTFANNTDWATTTELYRVDGLTIRKGYRGWIEHKFDRPFIWDGVSSVVVQISRVIENNVTQGARTYYTSGGSNKVLYFANNNAPDVPDLADYVGSGSRSGNRPDMQFSFVAYGCAGPAAAVPVTIVGTPEVDAQIAWTNADGTDEATDDYSIVTNSCAPTPLYVKIHNAGTSTLSNYTYDYWIGDDHYSIAGTKTVPSGATVFDSITSISPIPGLHTLRLAINATGDTVRLNDTIVAALKVQFCAGTYTLGHSSSNDYASFGEAVQVLNDVGIGGPVTFLVEDGTYNEQINLGYIMGSTDTSDIVFRSASRNASRVNVVANPTMDNNFVLNLNGSANIRFEYLTIYANGSSNYSNAVSIANAANVRFFGDVIRVTGRLENVNASCIVLGDSIDFVYIDSCVLDSGYYSVRGMVQNSGSTNGVSITQSSLQNFRSQGVYLRKVNGITIRQNQIFSAARANSRALTGLFIAEINSGINIERNNIVLYDNFNGGKQGIHLVNAACGSMSRTLISNNMISVRGTGVSGQVSSAIFIDSSSYINVYFNTCRLEAGGSALSTKTFSAESSSTNVNALCNIFDNRSAGYAFYVSNPANIASSDYNVYFNTAPDTMPYAYCGEDVAGQSTVLLSRLTGQDFNSRFDMPYYESDQDLHLSTALYNGQAQYQTSVPSDIDGKIRPQIPAPCIGAHEPMQPLHDIAILEITEPTFKDDWVEMDTVRIIVKIYNNGSSSESDVQWYCEVQGANPPLRIENRTIAEIRSQQTVFDTAYIVMPLRLIDTQTIHAAVIYDDYSASNNETTSDFYLDPAYNLQAVSLTTDAETSNNCRLTSVHLTMDVTNVGRRTIPIDYPIEIGYYAEVQSAGISVPNLPLSHTETVYLTEDLVENGVATLTFQTPANIFPTGVASDIMVRMRTWANHQHDQRQRNDTTSYEPITSKYTPARPISPGLQIPYATWDTIHATQTDINPSGLPFHLPIRWYRDSTDTDPYFTIDNYNRSCWWETPQYFRDTVYYLSSISTSGCTSYYQPVYVNINPRVPVDASIQAIESPFSKVYMSNDTVKVRIINYGTQPISNIPVVYQYFDANGHLLQQVREVCTATIAPDATYLFSFDSLVIVPGDGLDFKVRAWTDLSNEQIRRNDTIRNMKEFRSLPESTYKKPSFGHSDGVDVAHLSYSTLNIDLAPVGREYNDFADTATSPVAPLHLIKGTNDTLIVTAGYYANFNDTTTNLRLMVFIDYDRNGVFDSSDVILDTNVHPNTPIKFPYTVPYLLPNGDGTMRQPCLGYMRMRVLLAHETLSTAILNTIYSGGDYSINFGNAQDYMLYIEDKPEHLIDLAASRIVSPTDRFVDHIRSADSSMTEVTFLMTNKGRQEVSSANIDYRLIHTVNEEPQYDSGSFVWSGALAPGQSVPVTLPEFFVPEGTTELTITVSAVGDGDSSNNVLPYEYHRFKNVVLYYDEKFENRDFWYAPKGYSPFDQNSWQRGQISKQHLTTAYSDSTAWATVLDGYTNHGEYGNLSILYTPVFDIAQIRPDTITFYLACNIGDSSSLKVQYFDYLDRWIDLGTASDTLWYNSSLGFTGSTSGFGFLKYVYSTRPDLGDFQQRLQFRFVYRTKPGERNELFDGVVLDDAFFGRMQAARDIGVIDIVYPTAPKFGETIRPKVMIKNFGYDTIFNAQVAYDMYGQYLPKMGDYVNHRGLAPGDVDLFEFPDPFIVYATFPDTFTICAYSVNSMDNYWENDSTCKDFYLSPLDNDMGMSSFVLPADRIIAGDSITVTTRIRNYGYAPVSATRVTYVFNGNYSVSEEVDFNQLLGRPLESFEYFNYTFHQKCRASMGVMDFEAYCEYAMDDYLFNDTITKRVQGISAITDLSARAIVVDTSSHGTVSIQLIVDNVGARSASTFDVGFYYDNDTSTLVTGRFHNTTQPLAALSSSYYVFDVSLPQRAAGYNYVTGFVTVAGDNDRSNDTTTLIEAQFVDLHPIRVLVEENRYDTCHVRVEVENLGNLAYTKNLIIEAVVNGQKLRQTFNKTIEPGRITTFTFNGVVNKSSSRTYVGTGTLDRPSLDANTANNQTSVVEVQNYFEGVPMVVAPNGMSLEQNYPNPFSDETEIEFYLPEGGSVRFFVIDALGRLVLQRTATYDAGKQTMTFDGTSLSSGTYYYGIEKDGVRLMRKMVYKN